MPASESARYQLDTSSSIERINQIRQNIQVSPTPSKDSSVEDDDGRKEKHQGKNFTRKLAKSNHGVSSKNLSKNDEQAGFWASEQNFWDQEAQVKYSKADRTEVKEQYKKIKDLESQYTKALAEDDGNDPKSILKSLQTAKDHLSTYSGTKRSDKRKLDPDSEAQKKSDDFWKNEKAFWNTINSLGEAKDPQALSQMSTQLSTLERYADSYIKAGDAEAAKLTRTNKQIENLKVKILGQFSSSSAEHETAFVDYKLSIYKDPTSDPKTGQQAKDFWTSEKTFWTSINDKGYPKDFQLFSDSKAAISKIEDQIDKNYQRLGATNNPYLITSTNNRITSLKASLTEAQGKLTGLFAG